MSQVTQYGDSGYNFNQGGSPESQVQQPMEWPVGGYTGDLLNHELVTSQIKGTPGIRMVFQVADRQITVDIWITEASSEIAVGQLGVMGWNGDFENPEFSKTTAVPLYMKREDYKGKPQERWSISSFERKPPPAAGDSSLAQLAARYKAKTSAPPPAPSSKPPVPTVAKAPAPKAPPPPAKGAKAPPADKTGLAAHNALIAAAVDQDSAWAVWAASGGADASDTFWAQVYQIAPEGDPAAMTEAMWKKVAAAAPPF